MLDDRRKLTEWASPDQDKEVTKGVVSLHTSKPGMVIGQKGAGVETIKAGLKVIAVWHY